MSYLKSEEVVSQTGIRFGVLSRTIADIDRGKKYKVVQGNVRVYSFSKKGYDFVVRLSSHIGEYMWRVTKTPKPVPSRVAAAAPSAVPAEPSATPVVNSPVVPNPTNPNSSDLGAVTRYSVDSLHLKSDFDLVYVFINGDPSLSTLAYQLLQQRALLSGANNVNSQPAVDPMSNGQLVADRKSEAAVENHLLKADKDEKRPDVGHHQTVIFTDKSTGKRKKLNAGFYRKVAAVDEQTGKKVHKYVHVGGFFKKDRQNHAFITTAWNDDSTLSHARLVNVDTFKYTYEACDVSSIPPYASYAKHFPSELNEDPAAGQAWLNLTDYDVFLVDSVSEGRVFPKDVHRSFSSSSGNKVKRSVGIENFKKFYVRIDGKMKEFFPSSAVESFKRENPVISNFLRD